MNWYPSSTTDDNDSLEYDKIVVISFRTMSILTSVTNAFADIGVSKESIEVQYISGGEMVANFHEQILQKLTFSDTDVKRIMVINLLPFAVNMYSVEEELSMTTNWLSFESTLEILKVLSKNESVDSKLVAFTCQTFGCELNSDEGHPVPWAATVLGMARATNLETDVSLIPIDFGRAPSDEEVKKALLSLNLRSVEEGLVISSTAVHQPLFQRVKADNSEVINIVMVPILKLNP